jgi:eukaryotic-like serine/threonine-protein kinase
MSVTSIGSFVQSLRQYKLLNPQQLDDLQLDLKRNPSDPRTLAQQLMQRGWLTAFQVNQLLRGRVQDLILGPYLLVERLGEGGVGNVFKARHLHMQRDVALKVIRAELVKDAEVVARFYREVQAVSQMVHPNIVLAHDAGPAGLTHFFVMEYVEGVDLGRLVKSKGPLRVAQACDYIRQAALGLQHIHERGLVHRDIKPSNLQLTQIEASMTTTVGLSGRSFPYGLIKILDLGLARFDESDNEEIDGPLTQAGAGGIRGSVDYLSPEQAVDFHQADIRADIYGLGCTFYYLLTGKPPFPNGSLAQRLMNHQRVPAPPLSQLRGDLPEMLDVVGEKMLAKDPKERFQQPIEVAAALASLTTTPRRKWYEFWKVPSPAAASRA